jgi:hypothetical protein
LKIELCLFGSEFYIGAETHSRIIRENTNRFMILKAIIEVLEGVSLNSYQ